MSLRHYLTAVLLVLAPAGAGAQRTASSVLSATIPAFVVVKAVSELEGVGATAGDSLYAVEVELRANAPYTLRVPAESQARGVAVLGADGRFHPLSGGDVLVARGGRRDWRQRVVWRVRRAGGRQLLRGFASGHLVASSDLGGEAGDGREVGAVTPAESTPSRRVATTQ